MLSQEEGSSSYFTWLLLHKTTLEVNDLEVSYPDLKPWYCYWFVQWEFVCFVEFQVTSSVNELLLSTSLLGCQVTMQCFVFCVLYDVLFWRVWSSVQTIYLIRISTELCSVVHLLWTLRKGWTNRKRPVICRERASCLAVATVMVPASWFWREDKFHSVLMPCFIQLRFFRTQAFSCPDMRHMSHLFCLGSEG